MNVRDATPDDEPWMLETLDALGMRDAGFRSYHYIVVTTDAGDKVGLGRLTKHDDETVELTHVGAIGDQEAAAKAHAAKGLVKRAINDGYGTILVTADSKRPFEAVGFEAAEPTHDRIVDASESETVLRWMPPSQREDENNRKADPSDETDTDDRGGLSYKYDPGASSSSGTAESTSQQAQADSTEAAARRQGIDPESVDTKYDADRDSESKRTKYDG